MTEKEVITLRANILGGMNEYMRHGCTDEEQLELWDAYGVPDECDEDLLMEIAENETEFTEIFCLFYSIMKMGVLF